MFLSLKELFFSSVTRQMTAKTAIIRPRLYDTRIILYFFCIVP